jgi:hypothetical protein
LSRKKVYFVYFTDPTEFSTKENHGHFLGIRIVGFSESLSILDALG